MRLATHALTIILTVVVSVAAIWYARELLLFIKQPWILWLLLFILLLLMTRSIAVITKVFLREYLESKQGTRVLLIFAVLLFIFLVFVAAAHVLRVDPFRGQAGASSSLADAFSQLSFHPENINETLLEQLLHQGVNQERDAAGLILLERDAALEAIARAHGKDMVTRKFFEHVSPDGKDAIARGEAAHYNCTKRIQAFIATGIGENLARTPLGNIQGCGKVYTEKALATCTVRGWMNSTEHRKNILTATYTKSGMGVARFENEFFITQNFC